MNHRMSHSRAVVLAALAVFALFVPPARADIVLSLQSPITASPNTTGDAFDVLLTNTGASAVNIAAFSFGITTSDTDITFTDANTSTSDPYIFFGDSFVVINGFDLATTPPPLGQTLVASDLSNSGAGTNVGPGSTLGIGHVLFNVANGAALGPEAVTFEAYPTTSLADSSGDNLTFTANAGTADVASAVTAVPEPATAGLLVCALMGCATLVRRRRA